MKFPNFLMNRSFSARAFVLIAGLFLLATVGFGQKTPEAATTLDIDQCANGPLASPVPCNTAGANQGYTRGNLVASKSHYLEGDFVPIRVVSENLALGSYNITIGFDYTKGGKYATDYIGDFDETESVSNDPCAGVSGCLFASRQNFAVPPDPQVAAGFDETASTSDDIAQIAGSISCFGCTITNVTVPTLATPTTGDSSKFMTITFTANQANIVIAYGSHISTRSDWGLTNSAINISGSPYHNFISSPGTVPSNNGNRDLQLSAEAVIFPGHIFIQKEVITPGCANVAPNSVFNFGASANFGFTAFTRTDNNATPAGEIVPGCNPSTVTSTPSDAFASQNIVNFGSGNTITVSELTGPGGTVGAPTDWTFLNVSCVEVGGIANSTMNSNIATASIIVEEGETITCTFTNSQLGTTAAPASITGRVLTTAGSPVRGVYIKLTDVTTGQVRTALTNSFGFYTFTDLTVEHFYQMTAVSTKKYQFDSPTRTFTLTEDLAGVDFITSSF